MVFQASFALFFFPFLRKGALRFLYYCTASFIKGVLGVDSVLGSLSIAQCVVAAGAAVRNSLLHRPKIHAVALLEAAVVRAVIVITADAASPRTQKRGCAIQLMKRPSEPPWRLPFRVLLPAATDVLALARATREAERCCVGSVWARS
jgi:hypothetical protein